MTGEKLRHFLETSPISGGNGAWVEAMYEQYLADPDSVEASWRDYFKQMETGGARHDVAHSPIQRSFAELARAKPVVSVGKGGGLSAQAASKQSSVLRLINYYRVRGHQAAKLDPLGLANQPQVPDLDPAFHGLGSSDMENEFDTGSLATANRMKLREIIDVVKRVYTDSIGAEYMYITETQQKRWIQRRLEGTIDDLRLTPDEQKEVLKQLTAAEGIERYMHTRYVGQKRFSLEGGDSLIPALDELIRRDVKYHKGFSNDIEVDGRRVHMVLAFNPSHLEIVNPVVEGSVKSRQHRRGDERGNTILPVLVHGDAAFAGQGVVMETLQLSQAKGYATGGTVHFIVNNQVGFTTNNPIEVAQREHARTSLYSTDIAKMLEAPVFHVNADDPEAVVFVTRLAMDFRSEFHKDVIVDLVCYRRHGHNEADEPAVTQPKMYEIIKGHPTPRAIYAKRLEEAGVIDGKEADQLNADYRNGLDNGENIARNTLGMVGNQFTVNWGKYVNGHWDAYCETNVPAEQMKGLADKLLDVPDGFTLHNRVERIMKDRRKMAAGGLPIDWGFAETMAYAGLIDDGFQVRLSGQDSGRGTFFHRQCRLINQKDGEVHVPLRTVGQPEQFVINDTLLSEEGVLGFEYGYATAQPETLVIWEAQFGDFANGAQVVVDQFIASGHAKWARVCGLTMLLPHGYEGQGPEHSSARLERYLQLCAADNMQVCVPSTPSQFFHMLRRQLKRDYRLPLIVMTPKSLLRHKQSVSSLEDLQQGRFETIIDDKGIEDKAAVRRIVLCSGKVYFDLLQKREELELQNQVALVRIEQLYPFPRDEYKAILARYGNASEIVWCQEEPENQGAWYQIKHRLLNSLGERHVMLYATRAGSPSTATGYHKVHVQEQEELVREALESGNRTRGE